MDLNPIDALLATLRNVTSNVPQLPDPTPEPPSAPPHEEYSPFESSFCPAPAKEASTPSTTVDVRELSFRDSLPVLHQLTSRIGFVDRLMELKVAQDDLERTLWKEREMLVEEWRGKMDKAHTVAVITGQKGVSAFESKSIADRFQKALSNFYRSRVTPAWQSEILSQQAELEKLGVPSMFIGGDRHKQRKVVGALEGMMGD